MKPSRADQVRLVKVRARLDVDSERPKRVTQCIEVSLDPVANFRATADAASNQDAFRVEAELDIV